jgi:hypothetical protein
MHASPIAQAICSASHPRSFALSAAAPGLDQAAAMRVVELDAVSHHGVDQRRVRRRHLHAVTDDRALRRSAPLLHQRDNPVRRFADRGCRDLIADGVPQDQLRLGPHVIRDLLVGEVRHMRREPHGQPRQGVGLFRLVDGCHCCDS